MRFTIVTAVRDGFREFRETYPTVLAQTVRDFEWLIVDDGSREPLPRAFPDLPHDPRVKIVRFDQSQGQTAGLNLAIREARGEWIVRMDGDDLCLPDRLARLEAAITPQAELIFSDYEVIDENGRSWSEIRYREPLPAGFFAYLETKNNPICHPTVAFRRESAGKIRLYREDLKNAQDYALWKEILEKHGAAAFSHSPHVTLRYRIVRESLSGAFAPEQRIELAAIQGKGAANTADRQALRLNDPQKNAMQAFRVLYYRFMGHAKPATLGETLTLLRDTTALPGQVPKALFFALFRPFRRALLPFMFGGMYR